MTNQWRTLVQLVDVDDKEDLKKIAAKGNESPSIIVGKMIHRFITDYKKRFN